MDYPLYDDADALKAYLRVVGDGEFYIYSAYISKEANVASSPREEIRACLKAFDRPVKCEELFAALPHLPQKKIKSFLPSCEFVSNGKGAYFYVDILHLSEEDLENIAYIIQQTIEENDFIGGNELYDEIKAKYPHIIEENAEISVNGFRDALRYKFGNRFSFSRQAFQNGVA